MSSDYQIAIIGGGILGTVTAYGLSQVFPQYSTCVIEKESALATHQTGHNSGVIHSGIYYRPGSLKARNCRQGSHALMAFCTENGIPFDLCGKTIVATNEAELGRLHELHRRGTANGVPGLAMIGPEKLKELEPHAAGIMALHSPQTGIIDYTEVTRACAARFAANHGEVLIGTRVRSIRQEKGLWVLDTSNGPVRASNLINCGGLHADAIARMAGQSPDVRIIPFRGEYYTLAPEARHLVRGLIYPVPDPEFPFLGVHFTRTIHGDVEAGPNAVLAFAREGYRKTKVNMSDLLGCVTYRGFWAMASRYWKTGAYEWRRSLSKRAFATALQKLVPEIEARHLAPGGAGVRAQAVARNGLLVDDFRVVAGQRAIHVLNAPSPAATASFAISADIVAMANKAFDLSA